MDRKKPRLLIIGHARHGKDTVAELIRDIMGLKFTSSSLFVAEECIWPTWGKERYNSFEEMFADRVNNRELWANLISAYNTPNKTRTAATMLERGFDMYVGMRRADEFVACTKAKLFDYVIWVDRNIHCSPEPKTSMELLPNMANFHIDNNSSLNALENQVLKLQAILNDAGWDVNYPGDPVKKEPVEEEVSTELTWFDKPANAITVLDHGFIHVTGVMGNDAEIVEAARMSYGRGTKKVNSQDGLIKYLVQNHHTSPLEMGEIKFHMRLPIFVMRQLIRHRTANVNEYSGRYSEMIRLFYVPDFAQICSQDTVNKQGSAQPLDPRIAAEVQDDILHISNQAFDTYESLLKAGVSRETARIILPLNTYTECVWKLDISNLLKFLYLRDDSHAQYEIRVYAQIIAEAVEHFFPSVYAAYLRERNRISLNREQIAALISGDTSKLGKSEEKVVMDLLTQDLGSELEPLLEAAE